MSRFSELPEPVRLEDTITSDGRPGSAEPDTEQVVDGGCSRTPRG